MEIRESDVVPKLDKSNTHSIKGHQKILPETKKRKQFVIPNTLRRETNFDAGLSLKSQFCLYMFIITFRLLIPSWLYQLQSLLCYEFIVLFFSFFLTVRKLILIYLQYFFPIFFSTVIIDFFSIFCNLKIWNWLERKNKWFKSVYYGNS